MFCVEITKEEATLDSSTIGEWDKLNQRLTGAIVLHTWVTEVWHFNRKKGEKGQKQSITITALVNEWEMLTWVWNVMPIAQCMETDLVSTCSPQQKIGGDLDLENKVASYENIKFYDYIP